MIAVVSESNRHAVRCLALATNDIYVVSLVEVSVPLHLAQDEGSNAIELCWLASRKARRLVAKEGEVPI